LSDAKSGPKKRATGHLGQTGCKGTVFVPWESALRLKYGDQARIEGGWRKGRFPGLILLVWLEIGARMKEIGAGRPVASETPHKHPLCRLNLLRG
jgi:hypothetical protein